MGYPGWGQPSSPEPAGAPPGFTHPEPVNHAADDVLPAAAVKRSAKWRNLAAVACAVTLLGGGTATSLVLTASSSGGSSPQTAVADMFSAIEHVDVIGVLDALDPGERDAIEPGLKEIVSQLQRLDVLSPSADLDHVSGLSDHYASLDMTTEQLTSNVALVTVAATSETGTVDPAQLPLGSFITGLEERYSRGPGRPNTSTSTDGPTQLGTVEVNGSWYVSIGYSIAINALTDSGGNNPAPPTSGAAVQPQGGAAPEQAVQNMFNALSNLDLDQLVGDLAPDEMAGLDAYSPDWLPQAQAKISQLNGKVRFTFNNLDLSSQQVTDGTLVTLGRGLSFSVNVKGGLGLSYANGCTTVTENGSTHASCSNSASSKAFSGLLADMPSPVATIFRRLENSKPDDGFVTVEENGLWYVSPVRTVLQAVVAVLAELQPRDLTTVADSAKGISAGFQKWFDQELQRSIP